MLRPVRPRLGNQKKFSFSETIHLTFSPAVLSPPPFLIPLPWAHCLSLGVSFFSPVSLDAFGPCVVGKRRGVLA
jgi:hypothetical protein